MRQQLTTLREQFIDKTSQISKGWGVQSSLRTKKVAEKWLRPMRLRTLIGSVLVLGIGFGAWALPPPPACLSALISASDPTDSAESVQSHFSHESVWEVREQLLEKSPDRWREYLETRYGWAREKYAHDLVQLHKFETRLDLVIRGAIPELGELQIAEKYWRDPNVSEVEWIPESEKKHRKTPDLHIHYIDGGSKLVEVKTRVLPHLPDASYFETRMEKADLQFTSYKKNNPRLNALRAEVEFVLFFEDGLQASPFERASLAIHAEAAFRKTNHLTRATIHLNNKPLLRIVRKWQKGVAVVEREFIKGPRI